MGVPRQNLELKARDADPKRSLAVCRELEAEDRGILLQEDTYFSVPRGRLKLRQQDGAAARLIAYHRADLSGRRESRYRIVAVDDALEMKEALASVVDIAAVVKKSRRLFDFKGVRIHLDQVENLGSFIEFEGVARTGDDLPRFQVLLDELRRSFFVEDGDLVAKSYCDLVLAAQHSN